MLLITCEYLGYTLIGTNVVSRPNPEGRPVALQRMVGPASPRSGRGQPEEPQLRPRRPRDGHRRRPGGSGQIFGLRTEVGFQPLVVM